MTAIPDAGIQLVKQFEGFSRIPYPDSGGKLTVGYGHLIKPGESFTEISEEQAENLLRQDMQEAADSIQKHVTVLLNENQFSALLSLVFNLGPAPLLGGLGRCLNAGDYDGASQRFIIWDHSGGQVVPGLRNRREAEQALFNKPVDPPENQA